MGLERGESFRTQTGRTVTVGGTPAAGKVLTGVTATTAAWADAPAGGGGAPVGTKRADAWGYTQTNDAAAGSQARPDQGFDVSLIAGSEFPMQVINANFGGGSSVELYLQQAGWYSITLYLELQFYGAGPDQAGAGFNYGQSGYYYPYEQKALPSSGHVRQQWLQSGPLYVPAGKAIQPYADWQTAAAVGGAQFALDVTLMSAGKATSDTGGDVVALVDTDGDGYPDYNDAAPTDPAVH